MLNPLALLVAPLAGIALLTAAAAVALNPVLVSVSLTTGKKRRKRSLFGLEDAVTNDTVASTLPPEVQAKVHEMEVSVKYFLLPMIELNRIMATIT